MYVMHNRNMFTFPVYTAYNNRRKENKTYILQYNYAYFARGIYLNCARFYNKLPNSMKCQEILTFYFILLLLLC